MYEGSHAFAYGETKAKGSCINNSSRRGNIFQLDEYV